VTAAQPTGPLPNPYHLGMAFPVMPAPMIPEHCIHVPAGAVNLVVEARDLIADRQVTHPDEVREENPQFDDFGASLHIMSAADGVEHLRFDCFDNEPHYHYIRPSQQMNVIVRLDHVAEGDAIDWTISRLRERLPEMLDHAGDAGDVAAAVRADLASVAAALPKTQELLEEAQRRAIARRSGAGAAS
jgi:hypothetical protein